jgi:hypothetical protein
MLCKTQKQPDFQLFSSAHQFPQMESSKIELSVAFRPFIPVPRYATKAYLPLRLCESSSLAPMGPILESVWQCVLDDGYPSVDSGQDCHPQIQGDN